MQQLGKIKFDSDLRKIWGSEAKDFTPWLAENLDILGAELGIDLELISTEHGVGSFSLDIYAKDVSTNEYVVIENQLEATDHTHLGQLITYASGVESRTIVWITKEIREEHRKALDWLNQISEDGINFFGVEIQIVTIDNSPPAPLFKVKASPNEWSKHQKKTIEKTDISPRSQYYNEFFTKFLERVCLELPSYTNAKKVGYSSWFVFPSGISSFVYSISFRMGKRFSCELYIDTGNKEKNEIIFDRLYSYKCDIEPKLGLLSWEKLENKKACRIAAYIDETTDEEMIKWGIANLKAFKETLTPYIKIAIAEESSNENDI
ncbi:MAG: DUF4268 domain-containing protein [Syntrophomonadaceae bacterium]